MKSKEYTYQCDGCYMRPNGTSKKRWVVKSPQGREIAETIGEGSAKLIVKALNILTSQSS